jgi:hypothetical protein
LDGRAFGNSDSADFGVVKWNSRGSCDGGPYAHAFFADSIEIGEFIEELGVDFDA